MNFTRRDLQTQAAPMRLARFIKPIGGVTAVLLALAVFFTGAIADGEGTDAFKRIVSKKPALSIPLWLDYQIASGEGVLTVGSDAREVAYAYKGSEDGRRIVCANGKEFGPYGYIGALQISPDAKRFAFVASEKGSDGVFVVVDGRRGKTYDSIDDATLAFSPDSKHVSFIIYDGRKGEQAVVIDGKRGPGFPTVEKGSLIFSPDGRRHAYRIQDGGCWRVVADGRARKDRTLWGGFASGVLAHGNADRPVFSPDGRHIAYHVTFSGFTTSAVHQPKKTFLFVDGRKIDGRFQAFSPNGKRVAYTIKGEGYSDRILISNGILKSKSRQYSGSVHSVTFSPNGERVAYAVQEQDNSFVVLDDVEGKHYKGRGVVEDTIRVWPVGKGPRDSGSTDESIVENSLTFSPDGKRLAYVVSHGRGNFLVLDGQERREHNYHWYSSVLSRPVFSPDSRRVAYLAQDLETNEYYVVPDGHPGKRYTYIKYGSLQFSPDSRRFAYVVEDDEAFVVVDEIEGAEYGVCSRVVFDDSNRLHYLTRQGREIYLVEETWKIVTEPDYTLDNINKNSLVVKKRGGVRVRNRAATSWSSPEQK